MIGTLQVPCQCAWTLITWYFSSQVRWDSIRLCYYVPLEISGLRMWYELWRIRERCLLLHEMLQGFMPLRVCKLCRTRNLSTQSLRWIPSQFCCQRKRNICCLIEDIIMLDSSTRSQDLSSYWILKMLFMRLIHGISLGIDSQACKLVTSRPLLAPLAISEELFVIILRPRRVYSSLLIRGSEHNYMVVSTCTRFGMLIGLWDGS